MQFRSKGGIIKYNSVKVGLKRLYPSTTTDGQDYVYNILFRLELKNILRKCI